MATYIYITAILPSFAICFVTSGPGAPRYGERMSTKIEELKNRHYEILCQIFPNAEAQCITVLNETEASFKEKMEFLQTKEKLKAVEMERRNIDEDLLREQAQREVAERIEEENVRGGGINCCTIMLRPVCFADG